ncbi:helix-turn-helix transcriptional regulator [Rhodoferax lacus]|uniref:helix-turn-helix transcriptional regulator n=1 Tax=Rhodoferax lacus TaxID=2184758 RepID=UPI001314CE2B|nr:PAS domain S-box protein [Rhodoferax lacus]
MPNRTEKGAPVSRRNGAREPFSVPGLRGQAEAALLARAAPSVTGRGDLLIDAGERALHELRVHQIELEMQNEELRRRQVELHVANMRYLDLYDLAPVGYCTLSEGGQILQVNQTAASLLGMERNALVTLPFTRFVLSDDMDSYYLMCRALLKTGQSQHAELRMVRQGAMAFWAEMACNVSQGADGAPVLRLVLCDISERKRAEAEQARSDARYRALFSSIDEGFCLVDMVFDADDQPVECRLVEANSSFVQQTGLVDAQGKNLCELALLHDLPWFNVLGSVALTGQAVRFERCAESSKRWYDVHAFRCDPAQAHQVAVLLRDITERRARESEREKHRLELEEQVEGRTRQFLDLYDQAPCGYHSLGLDGVITRINKTGLALLGYTGQEVVGQDIADFMTPESARIFQAAFDRLLQTGSSRNLDLDFICKDGAIRPCLMNSDLVAGVARELPLIQSTLVDISERKLHAQRLELALMGADLGLWDQQIVSGELHLSARAFALLGYQEGEIGPRMSDYDKLVHPDDEPTRDAAFNAIKTGEVPYYRTEYRLRHKEGHWVWVRSQGRIVARDEHARPVRAAGTLQDISQERQLQQEGADLLQRIESLIAGFGKLPEPPPPPVHGHQPTAIGAREMQVLQLIAAGCTSAEVGERLHISASTAATHRRNLMRKLDLHSTAELTRYAVAHQLIAS